MRFQYNILLSITIKNNSIGVLITLLLFLCFPLCEYYQSYCRYIKLMFSFNFKVILNISWFDILKCNQKRTLWSFHTVKHNNYTSFHSQSNTTHHTHTKNSTEQKKKKHGKLICILCNRIANSAIYFNGCPVDKCSTANYFKNANAVQSILIVCYFVRKR